MKYAFLISLLLYTQPKKSTRALEALHRGYFEKCEMLVLEAIRKDSLTPSAYYVYAKLYSTPHFSRYALDSAHKYIDKALLQWQRLSKQEQEQMQRQNWSRIRLQILRQNIDSLAFQSARKERSIPSWEHFIRTYTHTKRHYSQAIAIRDSLAYSRAKALHTIDSYQDFMKQYPEASSYTEALKAYETLRYQSVAQIDQLSTWEEFLEEFPQSHYRTQAEQNILLHMTLYTHPQSFLRYLERYPDTTLKKRVIQLLASLDQEKYGGAYQSQYIHLLPDLRDSLLQAHRAPPLLIPIYLRKSQRYKFIHSTGEEGTFATNDSYDSLWSQYMCQGLRTKYILSWYSADTASIHTREGRLLCQGNIQNIDSLGQDFLRVQIDDMYGLWHVEAGQLLAPIYSDITWLSEGFLRIKAGKKVGLYSLLGKEILPIEYEEIYQSGAFLFLKKETLQILSLSMFKEALQKERKPIAIQTEEAEVVDEHYLITTKNGQSMLYNDSLEMLVGPKVQDFLRIGPYWGVFCNQQYVLFSEKRQTFSKPFTHISFNDYWLVMKAKGSQYTLLPLYERKKRVPVQAGIEKVHFFTDQEAWVGYDTLYVLGKQAAIGLTSEAKILYLPLDVSKTFPSAVRIQSLSTHRLSPSQGSSAAFYTLKHHPHHYLLNQSGAQTLISAYDNIVPLHSVYLRVEKAGKKGLIDTAGVEHLSPTYDAISYPDEIEGLSLLRDKKFGIFHTQTHHTLPATYESFPKPFGKDSWKIRESGKYGLIDRNNTIRIPFVYEELAFWNKDFYLGKREEVWNVYEYGVDQAIEIDEVLGLGCD